MGGPIDMRRKGYESIGCYTYFVTLTLDFQGQIFDSHVLGMGRSIDLEWKRYELDTT